MIEVHSHIWKPLRCFDHCHVQGRPTDRVDVFVRIDIVGSEVQRSGLLVDHPATHRNREVQDFAGDSNLAKRVNSAGGERQIDRASTNHVSLARIASAFVKIDLVAPSAETRREQSARESATNQNKLCHAIRIYESGNQESRKIVGWGAFGRSYTILTRNDFPTFRLTVRCKLNCELKRRFNSGRANAGR